MPTDIIVFTPSSANVSKVSAACGAPLPPSKKHASMFLKRYIGHGFKKRGNLADSSSHS